MASLKPTIGHLLSPEDKRKKEARDRQLDEIGVEMINMPLNKVEEFKKQFQKYDKDFSADLDEFEVKLMLEDMGKTVTHKELLAMIAEVDRTNSGTIDFREFLQMQGGKSALAQVIANYVTPGLMDRVKFFTPDDGAEERERRARELQQKKAAEEREKKRKQAASRARLAERAAMFNQS